MALATTSKYLFLLALVIVLNSCECANNVDTEQERSLDEFAQLNVVSNSDIQVSYNSLNMFSVDFYHESSMYQKYGSGNSFLGIKENDKTLFQSIVNLEADNYYSLFLLENNNSFNAIIAEDHPENKSIIRIINNTNSIIEVNSNGLNLGNLIEIEFTGDEIEILFEDSILVLNDDFKNGRIYNYVINSDNDYQLSLSIP